MSLFQGPHSDRFFGVRTSFVKVNDAAVSDLPGDHIKSVFRVLDSGTLIKSSGDRSHRRLIEIEGMGFWC